MSGNRARASERGYTLIELVAASVPVALIGLMVFSVFAFTAAFTRRSERQTETFQEARSALHLLAAELRESSTAPGALMVWSRDEGAPNDGIGFLAARAESPGRPFLTDGNGMPQWQEAVYYAHDRDSGDLRRITGDPATLWRPPHGAQGRLVARHIIRLRVQRREDLVVITVTVAKPPGEPTLEIAVRPRN
ncbi:MAG: hypothetical protein QN131_00145 [Armatimonadota bacterium]|nr:hypothetical protein [Armatimonadota bacterium]MDR7548335.1 hypothetical protein [Armatimonadota bacterium]